MGSKMGLLRKIIKVVRDKSRNSLTKEDEFLSKMDYLEREIYPHGPYITIFSSKAHDLARVRYLGVELLS